MESAIDADEEELAELWRGNFSTRSPITMMPSWNCTWRVKTFPRKSSGPPFARGLGKGVGWFSVEVHFPTRGSSRCWTQWFITFRIPLDIPTVEGQDPKSGDPIQVPCTGEDPFSALIFKVQIDTHGECSLHAGLFRELEKGKTAMNPRTGKRERVNLIHRVHANSRENLEKAVAGTSSPSLAHVSAEPVIPFARPRNRSCWRSRYSRKQ